jgi:hypothetical protein
MKLTAPLRMAQLAKLLSTPGDEWSGRRAKRWVQSLERERCEKLLIGKPYTVTLAALARACPDVFEPSPGLEARVEEAQEAAQRAEAASLQAAATVGVLRRQLQAVAGQQGQSATASDRQGPRRGVKAA